MKTRIIVFIVFVCFFLSSKTFAQGGPPMLTDDPGTVSKGHFEINSGMTIEHTASQSLFEFPFVDINYGVNARQHINIELPVVSAFGKGLKPTYGIGKLGIGTKYRFLDQDNAGIDVSTHPTAFFVMSDRAVSDGLVGSGTEFLIPFEFQKDIGKNVLGLEIGSVLNSKNPTQWTFGALYGREFSSIFNASAELNGSTNSSLDETSLYLNVGSRLTLTENFTLLFSLGKSLFVPTGEESTIISYLALQLSF